MVKDTIHKIYSLMASDKEVAAKLAAIKSPTEAVAILAEHNIQVSIEDLKEMIDSLSQDEIPVEMLDMVAGGGWVKDFFWGFCDGLRGAFNDAKDIFSQLFK